VGRVWEHLPPLFFVLQQFKWVVFGRTSPSVLSPIIQVGRVWEHLPPLFFVSQHFKMVVLGAPPPTVFCSTKAQVGHVWEHLPPLFFVPLHFKWVVFGSTLPLCFVSNDSSGSCLGAPPHSVLSPMIQVGRVWEHLPPLFFVPQHFKWVVFGSTLPLCFFLLQQLKWVVFGSTSPLCFVSNSSSGSCLGAPPPSVFCSPTFQVGCVWKHPPPLFFLSPTDQVGRVWEHLPTLFFVPQHFKWVVFGSTLPLCFFFLQQIKWVVFGSTSPLCFVSNDSSGSCLGAPPHSVLSPMIQVGRVWEHLPPLFFVSQHFKWVVFGSTSPLCFVSNDSSGSCLGAPPPSIFCSPTFQVGRVWKHPPPMFFLSPADQVGLVWEHLPPLFCLQ
jgi:hypothetical protein